MTDATQTQNTVVDPKDARITELLRDMESLPPGEAGFSLNWQMITPEGQPMGVTMRGATAANWPVVMRERGKFTEAAIKAGWKVPEKAPTAPTGAGTPSQPQANGASPQSGVEAGFYWREKNGAIEIIKGRPTLVLRGNTEQPESVACPIHHGSTLKRRTGTNGGPAWLSHKDGEGYCSANFDRVSA